ncbi:MAG TPA: hypothetical protein VMW52_00830 [Phycisphaerae bacterium]|nr:hypothetical protein [Phycisphaerae bacterium]
MRIKTLCIICAVTWLIPIGGCERNSAERIELMRQSLGVIAEQSVILEGRLVALESFLAESQAALADPNLAGDMAAEIGAGIERARAELAKVRPAQAKLDQVTGALLAKIATLQAGGDVDITDELQLVVTLLGASGGAIGGETGQWLKIGAAILGGLVTLLGGAYKLQRDKTIVVDAELAETQTALGEVVSGGEKFKKAAAAAPAEDARVLFKAAQVTAQQHEATRTLVAVARTKWRA